MLSLAGRGGEWCPELVQTPLRKCGTALKRKAPPNK
jgi:hypothetical protein